jgi:nucleoside-diphosphate-sugar epimerase
MRSLVTGATGHLGANLVRELLARGERVRVLLRDGSPRQAISGLEVEIAAGDLLDVASLDRALEGCQRLYHLGAVVSIVPKDRERLFATNVLGTRNVLQAAARAGVTRVVHCSSIGAVGAGPEGRSDEERLPDPFRSCMDYDLTKVMAEQEVLKAVMRGLDAVIVNPSGIVGRWDFRPSLLGRTILDIARGRLYAYIPGAFDLVPVDAVVAGHLSAMERGRTGERYVLAGELVTLDELIAQVAALTGARRPRLRIPGPAIYPYVRVKDWVERHLLPHAAPRYTLQTLKVLTCPKQGDSARACRELGYRPGAAGEAIRQAVDWYREAGYLGPPAGRTSAPVPGRAARRASR